MSHKCFSVDFLEKGRYTIVQLPSLKHFSKHFESLGQDELKIMTESELALLAVVFFIEFVNSPWKGLSFQKKLTNGQLLILVKDCRCLFYLTCFVSILSIMCIGLNEHIEIFDV